MVSLPVSPQELDEWLRYTAVDDGEEEELPPCSADADGAAAGTAPRLAPGLPALAGPTEGEDAATDEAPRGVEAGAAARGASPEDRTAVPPRDAAEDEPTRATRRADGRGGRGGRGSRGHGRGRRSHSRPGENGFRRRSSLDEGDAPSFGIDASTALSANASGLPPGPHPQSELDELQALRRLKEKVRSNNKNNAQSGPRRMPLDQLKRMRDALKEELRMISEGDVSDLESSPAAPGRPSVNRDAALAMNFKGHRPRRASVESCRSSLTSASSDTIQASNHSNHDAPLRKSVTDGSHASGLGLQERFGRSSSVPVPAQIQARGQGFHGPLMHSWSNPLPATQCSNRVTPQLPHQGQLQRQGSGPHQGLQGAQPGGQPRGQGSVQDLARFLSAMERSQSSGANTLQSPTALSERGRRGVTLLAETSKSRGMLLGALCEATSRAAGESPVPPGRSPVSPRRSSDLTDVRAKTRLPGDACPASPRRASASQVPAGVPYPSYGHHFQTRRLDQGPRRGASQGGPGNVLNEMRQGQGDVRRHAMSAMLEGMRNQNQSRPRLMDEMQREMKMAMLRNLSKGKQMTTSQNNAMDEMMACSMSKGGRKDPTMGDCGFWTPMPKHGGANLSANLSSFPRLAPANDFGRGAIADEDAVRAELDRIADGVRAGRRSVC